jgi:hypothetical protein
MLQGLDGEIEDHLRIWKSEGNVKCQVVVEIGNWNKGWNELGFWPTSFLQFNSQSSRREHCCNWDAQATESEDPLQPCMP